MARYIDVQHLFKCTTCNHVRNGRCNVYCDHGESYTPDLNLLPTADVVEVKHGKWHNVRELAPRYVCSCCNHLYNNMGYKFCPNCGAKMDGEKTLKEREK